MGKPRLPPEIEARFPDKVVRLIYQFVPYPKPASTPKPSPGLQRELERLQSGNKQTAMYLRDLEDFLLK
jgi:hypothetical protein